MVIGIVIVVALGICLAAIVLNIYRSRFRTAATIEKLTENSDGFDLYRMHVKYRYDPDRIIARGFQSDQMVMKAILREALPFLPVRMEVSEYACSSFSITDRDGRVLMGRNYDFTDDTSAMLVYRSSSSVCLKKAKKCRSGISIQRNRMSMNTIRYRRSVVDKRRSVRTFDGKPLTAEDRAKIEVCCASVSNPYHLPIEFRLLEPAEYGLKSPVLNGETLYLAAKMKRTEHFEEAFGYAFEDVIMCAWSQGIGSVWIGGTMNREAFEKAVELKADEVMPCVTPLGYTAKKMSVREVMMRKGIKADTRLNSDALFFYGEYGQPITHSVSAALTDALEEVRWAPSAVNKQPWRIILDGLSAHFYEKQDKGYVSESHGDLQLIDVGIAMYHFDKTMRESGHGTEFVFDDPGIAVPENVHYVATVRF